MHKHVQNTVIKNFFIWLKFLCFCLNYKNITKFLGYIDEKEYCLHLSANLLFGAKPRLLFHPTYIFI